MALTSWQIFLLLILFTTWIGTTSFWVVAGVEGKGGWQAILCAAINIISFLIMMANHDMSMLFIVSVIGTIILYWATRRKKK